jgi:hypothetical protein
MKIFVSVVVVIVALSFVGCRGSYDWVHKRDFTKQADRSELVGKTDVVSPIDYKSGVYYFPCVRAIFANSLASFLSEHPELKVTAMSGDATYGYGHDQGYFVVLSPK